MNYRRTHLRLLEPSHYTRIHSVNKPVFAQFFRNCAAFCGIEARALLRRRTFAVPIVAARSFEKVHDESDLRGTAESDEQSSRKAYSNTRRVPLSRSSVSRVGRWLCGWSANLVSCREISSRSPARSQRPYTCGASGSGLGRTAGSENDRPSAGLRSVTPTSESQDYECGGGRSHRSILKIVGRTAGSG